MGIEKITSKITAEAEEIRADILKEARAEAEAILDEARKKAFDIMGDALKKGQEEKEKTVLRKRSVSYIDGRKVILSKKQEILKKAFDDAIRYITLMDRDRYVDFLVRLGISSDMYGGLLIFNSDERALLGPRVVKELNTAIFYKRRAKYGDEPLALRYHLSDEVRDDIKGGFIIKYRMTYADDTVEAFVDSHRMELSQEVSKMLFEEE